jgi:adenylyltransferase/sulfurtransferase
MPDSNPRSDAEIDLLRYDRQIRFAPLGRAGQLRLAKARCVIIGCGALGSVQANLLARAGVGRLRIVDRDFVESSNLQRQVLFDEHDVAEGLPKAIAAANHLARINSRIEIEPVVEDAYHANIRGLCADADIILDGTDNFETRFLINDLCVSQGSPWVYGGCIGAEGQAMTIVPGETPCLRCLMPEGSPPPGTTATCDTAGILAPIINVIAAIQVTEAIKLMSGNRSAIQRKLVVIDVWTNTMRQLDLSTLAEQGTCPCCGAREFEYLSGRQASRSVVLCGRNSVQISATQGTALSLDELERKLSEIGEVQRNEFLLRFAADDVSITVFTDGRAIISGTADPGKAKSIYARYVGN